MTYDIFISYSREDEPWAAKLENNLAPRGFRIFRDKKRLDAGDQWEPKLRDAIVEAQTLVVLWSDSASRSNWVLKEQEAFRQMMHVDAREGRASVRRMLQICLEHANPVYPAFQTIPDLSENNVYGLGAAQVDPNVWNQVLDKVERAARLDANLPTIHQVILACTRDRLEAVADNSKPAEDAMPYADLIAGLSFNSKEELLERYGDDASEWRPFGGQKSILTLMSEFREELLSRRAPPFLWKPVTEGQWPGIENKRKLRDLLMSEACVIIIDAVSLYDIEIRGRYDWLLPCLDNKKAVIAVLPLYASSKRDCLRTLLEAAASKLFEPFYRPDKATVPISANCCVLADDQYEVSRLVAAMIRTSFRKERNPSLRFGSRSVT
jgi:hypothetical protein